MSLGQSAQGELFLDWLSVTLPTESLWELGQLLQQLDTLFPGIDLPYGGMGYTRGRAFFDGGRILWNPDRLEMGIHVSMSSRCLAKIAELQPRLVLCGAAGFIQMWRSWGATITRLDVAIDTDVDIVSRAKAQLKTGEVVTRARQYRSIENREIGGEMTGQGVEIGSRSSNTFVHIYDKAKEQGESTPRFRLEYEYKNAAAQKMAELVTEDDMQNVRDAMYAHLDFKAAGSDSNKSRWPTSDWWAILLAPVDKLALGLSRKAASSMDQVAGWLDRQAGPNLALFQEYCSQNGIDFLSWVEEQRRRWKRQHLLILQAANLSAGAAV